MSSARKARGVKKEKQQRRSKAKGSPLQQRELLCDRMKAEHCEKLGAAAIRLARAEAETAMAESRAAHARLRDAIDMLPQGIVILDAEGRYILWNQKYAEIYKGSADLFQVGVRLEDTLRIGVARGDYPEAIGREEEWLTERLARLTNPGDRHEQTLADGRCILIEERRTSDGGCIGLRVDITEMKQREASFRLFFEANPVPMFVYSAADLSIIGVNEAAVRDYGYSRAQFLTLTLRDIQDAVRPSEMESFGFDAATPEHDAGRPRKHRKSDGTPMDVTVFSRSLVHDGVPAILMAAIDITETKRAEAKLVYMAHHDALTGLPNRQLLRQHLEEALRSWQRSKSGIATLCIDLDNFKCVNDMLGFPCGDALLQAVADRIRSTLRREDTAARLGADEFAILLSGVVEPEEASEIAERLIQVISEPYDIGGHQAVVGASVGIAIAPGDGSDADRLLKNAGLALHRAKTDGKGTHRFFEADMDARVQSRRRLEVDLRQALSEGQLDVHYQPLVDLATGEVTGLEALLRWAHPERGMISPAEFIPVAEETGLIGPVGSYVLRRACADAVNWPEKVKVAVNLSPLQFRTGTLFTLVENVLKETGLSAKRLELEITETLLLDRAEHVLATLHALRALGVRISMDDFGTGYSSLSYLRSFPFDKIKIYRSFISNVCSNHGSKAIVGAILSLGASLGMQITAEGIETEEDLACLKAKGCNEGQGYFFSKPRPQCEILDFLAARSARHAA